MRTRRPEVPTRYSKSKTIPGQSLIPAELLKRHLAGTLPDIAKVPKYTHDENGVQIAEDLSHLELHELHELTMKMKAEYHRRQKQLEEEQAENYKKSIIEEHQKSQSSKQPALEETPGTAAVSAKRDGAAGSTGQSTQASAGTPRHAAVPER